ncbi:hypothetical protein [Tomitella gaofuii]|uniref:hypothetical protein n=1 Tax=Tomitella gaofuii TaxID=2760083 RepID=UPI0015F9AFAB|nr:hypothetical protein [Tomitella gaofuii]
MLGGAVAAATLSVTVWQPASAAPQTDMTWSGTDAAQATTLSAGPKEAVRRDLGISPREYVERAHDARAVSAEAQRLREDDPGAFGAAWLRQDGTPTIAVTAAAAAQEVHGGGDGVPGVPKGSLASLGAS